MSKATAVFLVLLGMFCTGVAMIDHPSIKPFAAALGWFGFTLGTIAKTTGLLPSFLVIKHKDGDHGGAGSAGT